MAAYGSAAYWEERYRLDSSSFDWYTGYGGLRSLLTSSISRDARVLHVGCGTSSLAELMRDDGYTSLLNVDSSRHAIEAMRARAGEREGFLWEVVDAVAMPYDAGAFDAVIDKGTLDALLCGEDSTKRAERMCKEVRLKRKSMLERADARSTTTRTHEHARPAQIRRVLSPGGVFLLVSHGAPGLRLCFLSTLLLDWTVEHKELPKPVLSKRDTGEGGDAPTDGMHHVYICRCPGA